MRTENDNENENENDAVPVLNEVVESGNESIIQSSRLGREVLRELEMLQQSNPVKFVLQDHILNEEEEGDSVVAKPVISPIAPTMAATATPAESQLDLSLNDSGVNNATTPNSEDEIELMIDEMVDRHIHDLRQDIRRLLTLVKHKT